jgi:Uma2 family endonuclease
MATVTSKPPRADNRPASIAGLADRLHRFTIEEYRALPAAGLLAPDARVELLEGVIVDMTPIGPLHCLVVEEFRIALEGLVPHGWHVRTQYPISIGESEPQPDVGVVRGSRRDYGDRHPGSSEIGLVVEVADTSLMTDRNLKIRVYAGAGIPEYWIVHVAKRQVEVLREPYPAKGKKPAGYRQTSVLSARGKLPLILDGVEVGRIELASVFA